MSMRMKRAEMGTDLVFWDWFVPPAGALGGRTFKSNPLGG